MNDLQLVNGNPFSGPGKGRPNKYPDAIWDGKARRFREGGYFEKGCGEQFRMALRAAASRRRISVKTKLEPDGSVIVQAFPKAQ